MNTILRINPTLIDIPEDRLRLVDRTRVAEMVQSLLDVGQLEPIEVAPADANGRHRLIIGAHRVAAAHLAEMDVLATVFEGTPQQMRLREIDENLYRSELNPLDQAAFLAERRMIWEQLYGPIQAGRPTRTHNSAKLAGLSFYKEVAEKFGLPDRTLRRALARKDGISPAVWGKLRGSPIAGKGSELDQLARLPEPMQERVVALILDDGAVKTVAAALRSLGSGPAAKAESGFDRFVRLWDGLQSAEKSRVLEFLIDKKLVQRRPYNAAARAELED